MNKTKQGYVAPLSDLLVVRFEEGILTTSGDMAAKNWTAGESDWFNDEA